MLGAQMADIMALTARAPWREAVTYRQSWPHEYVVVRRDGQEALLAAFCARIAAGEGLESADSSVRHASTCSWVANNYWTMTNCSDVSLGSTDYVLNRALLYRDRRDFVIKPGDPGVRGEGAQHGRTGQRPCQTGVSP